MDKETATAKAKVNSIVASIEKGIETAKNKVYHVKYSEIERLTKKLCSDTIENELPDARVTGRIEYHMGNYIDNEETSNGYLLLVEFSEILRSEFDDLVTAFKKNKQHDK